MRGMRRNKRLSLGPWPRGLRLEVFGRWCKRVCLHSSPQASRTLGMGSRLVSKQPSLSLGCTCLFSITRLKAFVSDLF